MYHHSQIPEPQQRVVPGGPLVAEVVAAQEYQRREAEILAAKANRQAAVRTHLLLLRR